ncbi:MAG: Yip1 family protein [Methanoregula sp.]|jgi:hypothetical protein|uniref:YIP1 family protein n=1 Tax=Methanoregula sp. TaxID=2052170 RepID=UPI003C278861
MMKESLINLLINTDTFFRNAMEEEENFTIPVLIVLAVGIISAAYGYLIGRLTSQMMSAVTPGIESIILISTILGAIIGTFVFWLIWAGVLYGFSAVFKGEGTFKRTLEFTGYGYLPQIIGSFITLAAAFEYLPEVKVPQISTAGIPTDQLGQVIQNAVSTMMHDPAMVELTQITVLITIVFLLWSANIWIFGIRHARKLSPRDGALCVGIPVIAYILYMIYNLGVS